MYGNTLFEWGVHKTDMTLW